MTDLPKKRRKSQIHSIDKRYYPAFLDITGKSCVIVGGGKVAERKCSALLDAGADITVISPGISEKIKGYVERGVVKHVNRRYRSGDLNAAFIAVSATESEEV